MDILGVIPARSGSKGIKNKNIQKISNRTLLEISVKKLELLKKQRFIKDFIISTDSELYSNLSKVYGSKVQIRPKYLSKDQARIVELLNYLKKVNKNNYFLTLVPTAPLITLASIKKLIKFFIKKKTFSIGTVSKYDSTHPFLAIKKKADKFDYLIKGNFQRYPRQIRPDLYHLNGCVFIRHKKLITKNNYNNNCLGKLYSGFEISKEESCNIDNLDDLNFCRKNFNAKKIFK